MMPVLFPLSSLSKLNRGTPDSVLLSLKFIVLIELKYIFFSNSFLSSKSYNFNFLYNVPSIIVSVSSTTVNKFLNEKTALYSADSSNL